MFYIQVLRMEEKEIVCTVGCGKRMEEIVYEKSSGLATQSSSKWKEKGERESGV